MIKSSFKKFDSNLFDDCISAHLSTLEIEIEDIQLSEDIERITNKLIETVIKTCNEVIPKHKSFKNSNNWWSSELTAKRKLVNHLRRRYQRCKDQIQRHQRKVIYYNERQTYIQLIKSSKTKSWRKFCYESDSWGLPYKLLNNKLKNEKPIPNFKKSDGTYTQTHEESLQYALHHMFPEDDISTDTAYHQYVRRQTATTPDTSDDKDFTQNELNEVINNLSANKASGWDQINDIIVKAIHRQKPRLLLKLYNKCLNCGYFPEKWKISVIRILLKSRDKPISEVKSYRPISLLPLMAKIFEKLLINRINHHMYSNQLLSKNQFGFTPNTSTEDALETVHKLGQEVLKNREYLLIIVLDITGAFDNCWWHQILKQLKDKNCPKNLYKTIRSYCLIERQSLNPEII